MGKGGRERDSDGKREGSQVWKWGRAAMETTHGVITKTKREEETEEKENKEVEVMEKRQGERMEPQGEGGRKREGERGEEP